MIVIIYCKAVESNLFALENKKKQRCSYFKKIKFGIRLNYIICSVKYSILFHNNITIILMILFILSEVERRGGQTSLQQLFHA